MINADKTQQWKADTRASIDQFNAWFMDCAPKTFRDSRVKTVESVKQGLLATTDLTQITPEVIRNFPATLQTLRMSTCPPLARDRLAGLAGTTRTLVVTLEEGRLPRQMSEQRLKQNLEKLIAIIARLLDVDILPWIGRDHGPSEEERYRSSTIIADRLCGAVADPIVRNAQEQRQLALIEDYLVSKGYAHKPHPTNKEITEMEPGTFAFRTNVFVRNVEEPDEEDDGEENGVVEVEKEVIVENGNELVRIPIDVVIQLKSAKLPQLPILIEAKSAGDFANTNKRRKEEKTKMYQLKATFGDHVRFILFLCGYFGPRYLGYEAAEGIDWVWEHRITDLDQLGI